MTVGDFFSFDPAEYAQRISEYDTDRLRKQEVVKTRQRFAGGNSIAIGIGAAPFSGGGTLAVSAYGGRRLYVADKKLELIRLELQKRSIQLRVFHKRDVLIPFGASAVGLGVGFGPEEIASAATNTVPMGTQVPTGSSMIQEVVANPGDVAQGLGAAFTEQTNEMATALTNMTVGVVPGSELSSEVLAASTVWTVAPSEAEAVGFYLGMLLAQGIEHSVIGLVGAQCAYSILECMGGHAKAAKTHHICPRTLGGVSTTCESCGDTVTTGSYWHCCDCVHREQGHNFDLCRKCYAEGKRCPKSSIHNMKLLQVAKDMDFFLDQSPPPAYGSWSSLKLNTVEKSQLAAGAFGIPCDKCDSQIIQGTWYHCSDCGGFDMCRDCFRAGLQCPRNTHTLEVRSMAIDCRQTNLHAKDCGLQSKNRTYPFACSACASKILQGRVYHYCNCTFKNKADNFYLCHPCYKSGSRCSMPSSHTLQMHLAGIDVTKQPYSVPGSTCSRCSKVVEKKSYFYHCKTCESGSFDICSPCNAGGKGCNDPKHILRRHLYN